MPARSPEPALSVVEADPVLVFQPPRTPSRYIALAVLALLAGVGAIATVDPARPLPAGAFWLSTLLLLAIGALSLRRVQSRRIEIDTRERGVTLAWRRFGLGERTWHYELDRFVAVRTSLVTASSKSPWENRLELVAADGVSGLVVLTKLPARRPGGGEGEGEHPLLAAGRQRISAFAGLHDLGHVGRCQALRRVR